MTPRSSPRLFSFRSISGAVFLAAWLLFAGCHGNNSQDANVENFTAAIDHFLTERGHLCLGKFDWPVYVTQDQAQVNTGNAVQMPVLEKLGLVTGKDMVVERTGADGKKITAQARQYSLTAEGQKYYLHFPVVIQTATSKTVHPADFCAGTLTLDRVVGWEPPIAQRGQTVTSVLYTYKLTPAPWASNPDAQRVFPWIKRIIEGQGTMQLREGVHLTAQGWVADEIFQR